MKTVASRRFCSAFRTTSTVFIQEARRPKDTGQNILDMQDPFPYPQSTRIAFLPIKSVSIMNKMKVSMAAFLKKMTADRVGGAIFILLGVIALLEARRLRPMRMRAAVGDDIFPMILGVVLLLLGALMAFVVTTPPLKVDFPRKEIARRMIASLACLFGYWALLPVFGYVPSTFLSSALLFYLFGGYRLRTCLVAAALLTAAVYLTFVRFLKMPFPIGVLGL